MTDQLEILELLKNDDKVLQVLELFGLKPQPTPLEQTSMYVAEALNEFANTLVNASDRTSIQEEINVLQSVVVAIRDLTTKLEQEFTKNDEQRQREKEALAKLSTYLDRAR